jgi:hypothetical protein
MLPAGIRTHDPSKRSAADRAATGIGLVIVVHYFRENYTDTAAL